MLTESPTFFRVAIDSRIFPAPSSTTEGATMSKPGGHEVFRRIVAQNVQGRLVDAEQARAVERMGDDAATMVVKMVSMVRFLLDDLVLVGAFLGDVDAHADGAMTEPSML